MFYVRLMISGKQYLRLIQVIGLFLESVIADGDRVRLDSESTGCKARQSGTDGFGQG